MSEPSEYPQDNARSLHDSSKRYVQAHEVIKNFALEVCQLLLAPADNPTGFVWDPDEEKTQIFVVDKYSFNLDQVGATPAIVANRGPLNWTLSSGFRQLQALDFRTDRRTYTDLIRGTAVLSVFSRQGIEAEMLAGYVWESFQVFRDVLRKIGRQGIMVPNHLGFFKVEATSMGEEALVKADSRPNLSVVPVALRAHVQRRYAVKPQSARKLKNVNIRTTVSGS